MSKRLHVNTRYSCRILMKLEFSRQFRKKPCVSNSVKILLMGAELFHANRRADGHEANSRFLQFCEGT
jgi:hypothetical protein